MLKNIIQKFKSAFGRYMILCTLLSVPGCDFGYDISGSFEEADISGRHLDGDATKELVWTQNSSHPERYFRFHFRQFGNDIGGTFETFDMSSYDLFKQTPTYMEQPLSYYYCARIDYGYVRDDVGYVFFTDREQRQWNMVLDLSTDPPSGTLSRFNSLGDPSLDNEDYYLLEDVGYRKKVLGNKMPYPQIALKKMSKDTKRSLGCIYYYKSQRFEVILPSEIMERLKNKCSHDKKINVRNCGNFKLAVVGMMPQTSLPDIKHIQELFSIRLDDCDIVDNKKRSIILRDNPFKVMNVNRSGIFIATLVLYKDSSPEDGHWDPLKEAVVATLGNQLLVFYDVPPKTTYGRAPVENGSAEVPIFTEDQFDSSTGWFIYNYIPASSSSPFKEILRITNQGDTLNLNAIDISGGNYYDAMTNNIQAVQCYLDPNRVTSSTVNANGLQKCSPFFPVLVVQ